MNHRVTHGAACCCHNCAQPVAFEGVFPVFSAITAAKMEQAGHQIAWVAR